MIQQIRWRVELWEFAKTIRFGGESIYRSGDLILLLGMLCSVSSIILSIRVVQPGISLTVLGRYQAAPLLPNSAMG